MLGDKGELPIAMALANVVASSQMVSLESNKSKVCPEPIWLIRPVFISGLLSIN